MVDGEPAAWPGPGPEARRRRLGGDPLPWVLAGASVALSLATLARYPTEWDSVQLTLGLDRFDVTEGSPHPPGYYLYVVLGRALALATPLDGQDGLQLLAALAGAATVALTYLLGRDLGGRWLGVAAAAFLATSPFLRFYSATVATYNFDALVSVALLLLLARGRGSPREAVLAAGVLGLAAGLRQTLLLVLGPLVALVALRSVRSVRAAAATAAAGAAGVLVWLVPMLAEQPGGLGRYRGFTEQYVSSAFGATSVFHGAPRSGVVRNMAEATAYTTVAVATLLPVVLAGAVLAALGRRHGRRPGPRALVRAAVALAVAVPFGFVLLVHFGKGGYVLSYLPALVLLLLWLPSRSRGWGRVVAGGLVVAACAVNLQRFVAGYGVLPESARARLASVWLADERNGAPYRLTRDEIRSTDRSTRDYAALAEVLDPSTDVLVYALENGGYRFRHATYTLPEFRIHYLADGQDHFLARHGRLFSERDDDVELPPNGRAVLVLDGPPPEVQALVDSGTATEQRLPSGRRVWVVPPGVTVLGVTTVVTADDPLPESIP